VVAKGLSTLIKEAKRQRKLPCIKVGRSESLAHLLFVDHVLLLCFGNDDEGQVFKDVLQLYCVVIVIEINENKFDFFTSGLGDTHNTRIEIIFPF